MAKVDRSIRLLVFITWGSLVVYGIVNHVYWRDEVRPLSIALSSESFLDLFTNLKNEGHPILWYLLLKVFHSLFNTPLVLGFLSLLFAFGFVYLLLFKTKIHWLFAVLIVFGIYGLYEYSINARNYGISVFLIFWFACMLSQKKEGLLPLICLVLLPQTNFYATMFTPVFLTLYILQNPKLRMGQIVAIGLVILSVFFAVLTCLPNEQSLVVKSWTWNELSWVHVWDVGIGFPQLLGLSIPLERELTTLLLLLSLLIFLRRKSIMLLAFALMIIMSFFHQNIRENYLHHQGVFIFGFIALIIGSYEELKLDFKRSTTVRNLMGLGIISFTFILTVLFYKGYQAYGMDFRFKNSNANELGHDLQLSHVTERVIIAEPDYIMESVMYYFPYPFWVLREQKMARFTHFTKENKDSVSLQDVLKTGDSLAQRGKKVDLVFGWQLPDTVHTYHFSYNKKFYLDSVSLKQFHQDYYLYRSYANWIKHDEYYYWYKSIEKDSIEK
jgi:hypothetical protein